MWLTVLLAVFGGAQAAFTWWSGAIQRRAAEAEADRRLKERVAAEVMRRRHEDREWDIAQRLATTEMMRLGLLVARFDKSETPELAVAEGIFEPHEFRIANQPEFARNMALVSPEAGDLAVMVITMADDFATQMLGLSRVVEAAAPKKGVDRLRELNTASGYTKPIVLKLRAAGKELKALVDDATAECRPAELGKRRLKGTPKSGLAKAYQTSWERSITPSERPK